MCVLRSGQLFMYTAAKYGSSYEKIQHLDIGLYEVQCVAYFYPNIIGMA